MSDDLLRDAFSGLVALVAVAREGSFTVPPPISGSPNRPSATR